MISARCGPSSLRAVVVTATVGEPTLFATLQSVQSQTHPWTRHLVVVDGGEHEQRVRQQIASVENWRVPLEVVVLPRSTGDGGFFGHRIYGAAGLLVQDDVVLFLDADNMFDPDHVHSCTHAMEAADARWAYSLRRVVDADGDDFCPDDCDSLGFWPRYPTYYLGASVLPPAQEEFFCACPYLIDTSCYAVARDVLVRWSRCWDLGWGADCVFATDLIRHEQGVATGQRTVAYRLDVQAQPDVAEYFLTGNELADQEFGPTFPWVASSVEALIAPPTPRLARFGVDPRARP